MRLRQNENKSNKIFKLTITIDCTIKTCKFKFKELKILIESRGKTTPCYTYIYIYIRLKIKPNSVRIIF